MNFLSMLSEEDKKKTVAELASLLARDPHMIDAWELAVTNVFKRHGFRPGRSDSAVVHGVSQHDSERTRSTTRALLLSDLLASAKKVSNQVRHNEMDYAALNHLDIAIAAVEREFKQ